MASIDPLHAVILAPEPGLAHGSILRWSAYELSNVRRDVISLYTGISTFSIVNQE